MENTAVALAALEKNHILGYDDLTQKQQEHARTLTKGIYVENIMSQMRMLRSATTIIPTVQTDALSDIDIDSPPVIRREPENPCPTHVSKSPTLPKQHFMAGQKFISEQAEGNTDEQYNPPEEIDTYVQNPNLLLTSDHEYTDPFERPSRGGMVVYLNTIM
jgi:hypothetical protein